VASWLVQLVVAGALGLAGSVHAAPLLCRARLQVRGVQALLLLLE
jgi:hypothetical protein